MPAAVCDSSPLVYLARVGQFRLFSLLFDLVLIPPAVWEEVTIAGRGLPESACTHDAVSKGWLQVVTPCKQRTGIQLGSNELGAGETQAIQLAQERGLRLIIDETAGRNVARQLGVQIIGTLGMLVEAKRLGHLQAVKPFLDRLRSQTNFRLSQKIYDQITELAGEASHSP